MKVIAAHASLPALGEHKNGDRAIFRHDGDHALFAVIDGLGHGPGADQVSSTAAALLEEVDLGWSLDRMCEETHRVLGGTRGAAGTICLLRGNVLFACAVGNVEVRTGSIQLPLVASPGVLGVRVAKFRVCEAQVKGPGRIILFSDGISSRTRFDEMTNLSPVQCCETVLAEYRRDHDDSTILVADLEPRS